MIPRANSMEYLSGSVGRSKGFCNKNYPGPRRRRVLAIKKQKAMDQHLKKIEELNYSYTSKSSLP
jgi:hypothetical protein